MIVEAILAQAINSDLKQLEVISVNVANVNTSGYLSTQVIAKNNSNQEKASLVLNLNQGGINQTNNELDIAVKGRGFFVIEKGQSTYITRNGKFSWRNDGALQHISGGLVLSENGAIYSPSGVNINSNFKISETGEVLLAGGSFGRLLIVEPERDAELHPAGEGLYKVNKAKLIESSSTIMSGALNTSNVSASEEMVKMIEVSRHVQTLQKAANAYQQMLNTGISEIGK
ncbi:flagellar hook-basal body complex protein [Colwellia sp. MEBiC06753]